MKQTSRALAIAILAMLITSCSNGQPAPPLPVPELTESTSDSGLYAKLLTEADLPAGYTETALPSIKGGVGSVVDCPALDVRPSANAGEASVAFAGGSAGSLISETVRLTSAGEAKKALADLAAMPKQCGNAKTATLAKLGLESTAVQLTATPAGLGVTLDGYIVGVRDDTMVVLVVFVSPDKADTAAVEAIAKTAWEKAAPK